MTTEPEVTIPNIKAMNTRSILKGEHVIEDCYLQEVYTCLMIPS